MAADVVVGERVRVVEIRDGRDLPDDLRGRSGVVQWVTPGFAGERGYVEVRLDDGRIFQFQNTEIARDEPGPG